MLKRRPLLSGRQDQHAPAADPRRRRHQRPLQRKRPAVHGPQAPRQGNGPGRCPRPEPPHPGLRQAPRLAEHHLGLVRQVSPGRPRLVGRPLPAQVPITPPTGTRKARLAWLFLYPRAESNRNRQNRNLKFYPLNYGGRCRTAKILFFFENIVIFAKCFEEKTNQSSHKPNIWLVKLNFRSFIETCGSRPANTPPASTSSKK